MNMFLRNKHWRLQQLLHETDVWDETTWFMTQRYLVDNLDRWHLLMMLDFTGLSLIGDEEKNKTELVRRLNAVSPRELYVAWTCAQKIRR